MAVDRITSRFLIEKAPQRAANAKQKASPVSSASSGREAMRCDALGSESHFYFFFFLVAVR